MMLSYGLLHMDIPKLADQQKLTFISSVLTWDATKASRHVDNYPCWLLQWSIKTDGNKESRESVLSACLDDYEFRRWKENSFSLTREK